MLCHNVDTLHWWVRGQETADELMTYDVAQQLIDKIAETSPKLVEDFIPEKLTLGTVVRVLQNLLRERVPLRDMRTILETLSEESGRTQDAGCLLYTSPSPRDP